MAMPTLPKEPVAALVAESDTNELATLGLFGDIDDMFDLPFKIGRTLFKPFTEKKFATPDGRRMSLVELLIERMEREVAEQEAEGADGNNPTEPGTEDAPATEGAPATEDGAKNDADIDAFLSIFKGLSEQAPRND
ncbi:hypothetical protein CGCSCA1_v008670 [Colletotrichum siamense]|nr:hypothetical protein CGCSCA1_v008670 [Colletotrichum siamense]